jgi:hypothetical protein
MRLVLVILLTVAQLAGPWLCCCGPTRAANATAGPGQKSQPAEDRSQGGCPHCQKEPAPECPPSDQLPKTPHVPDRCPCGGVLTSVVPADKPNVPTTDSMLVVVSVEPPVPLVPVSAATPALVGLRELPLLTTADRLFAHHVLRC